jgi:osmotically-inducible protein OsmY
MKYAKTSRLFGAALASLLLTTGSLLADSTQDHQAEDAFRSSHIYRTQLENTNVSIDVSHGVAVLKGTVDNDDQRSLADDTARNLPGVERVDNRIRVTNEPKESSDDWISLKVRSALLFHRNVSATNTHIAVHEGVVTLTGTAHSDAEKALSEEYAKDVKGVRRVDNQLQVVTPADEHAEHVDDRRDHNLTADERSAGDKIDDASITAQIKSSLAVRKSTSALHTNVTTRDGVVTLTGEARNGAEKDLVTKMAENIDGVRSVHNEMSIQDR